MTCLVAFLKFFLPVNLHSPSRENPTPMPTDKLWDQCRRLQIRTSPRQLPQASLHPSLLWIFFGGWRLSSGRKLTDFLKENPAYFFSCLCFTPSPWLQADPHNYGSDGAVSLTTFYWKESALGRRGEEFLVFHDGASEHDEAFSQFKGPGMLLFAGAERLGGRCC